jgi:predicted nucleic acid-binding Zn ribbon protein
MSSRKNKADIQHIGDAIRELLHTYKLETRFDEATLLALWPEIAGTSVARHTRKVYVRQKKLFIELTSPSLKNDFMLHKNRILEIFREKFGRSVINDIIVK